MMFWKKLGVRELLNWLLPGYVFLLPYQARLILTTFDAATPRYGDLSVYVTDGIFWVLAITWFVYLIKEHGKAHPEWRRLRLPIAVVLVFFAYAALSLLWTPNQIVGREFLYRLAQAGVLGMIIVSGVVEQKRILIALAASGALQGLIAVQQFFTQTISASTWLGMSSQAPQDLGVSVIEYADQRWLRAYGTLPHPNMLGAFCAAGMLAASTIFWRGYRSLQRREVMLGWLTFICSYFGLLFSFSRSAWLAIALAGVVYIIVELMACDAASKKAFTFAFSKLILVCLLFLIFLTALFGPLWWSRSKGEGRLAQQSVSDRAALAEQSNILASNHPFIGSGLGSYLPSLVIKYPNQPTYYYQPVHVVWRFLRVEFGYVGLVLLVGILTALAITIYRFKLWAWLPSLTLLAASSFFDHFWYSLPFGVLFATILLTWPLAKTPETC